MNIRVIGQITSKPDRLGRIFETFEFAANQANFSVEFISSRNGEVLVPNKAEHALALAIAKAKSLGLIKE